VNEEQLEAILLRQRRVILYAQEAYNDLWAKNLELREALLELRQRLEAAGLPTDTPISESPDQLVLALFDQNSPTAMKSQ
jgi:hypothetical protein